MPLPFSNWTTFRIYIRANKTPVIIGAAAILAIVFLLHLVL